MVKWHVWFTPVACKPWVTITGDILKGVEFSNYPSLTLLQKTKILKRKKSNYAWPDNGLQGTVVNCLLLFINGLNGK